MSVLGCGLSIQPSGGVGHAAGELGNLDPGHEGEHEEENDSQDLPAGQHLPRLLPELQVNQEYCHPVCTGITVNTVTRIIFHSPFDDKRRRNLPYRIGIPVWQIQITFVFTESPFCSTYFSEIKAI